jgi:hypothetical protein
MITQAQGLAIFVAIVILGTLFAWLTLPDRNYCAGATDRTSYENCLNSYD